ncbi:Beta-galactosidase-1-like protein 3 [Manis javanica]|nr:Beta-galactosidase-1-like protein 3 [Manis javanica]
MAEAEGLAASTLPPSLFRGTSMGQKEANLTSLGTWTWMLATVNMKTFQKNTFKHLYEVQPVISRTPVHTENLPINNGDGQSYGLVLYETSICSGGRLRADAQDTAQVFLNETSIGILGDHTPNLSIPKIKK